MWHQFAHRPFQTLANPLDNVCHNATNQKKNVDREIRRALTRFSNRNRSAKRLYSELRWEDSSTLFIQLDINDPTDLHQAFSDLIGILHSQFSGLRYDDLKHYLIREKYERIIVIPTVRGRIINCNAWVLYTLLTILDSRPIEEHNWVSYSMHQLPASWIDGLELCTWDLVQIKLADKIHTAFIALMILTSQVSELVDLSEVSDEASELLASHAEKYSRTLSDHLQTFIDGVANAAETWNHLNEQEQERREHLKEALSVIIDVMNIVISSSEEMIEYRLDLEAMAEYSQGLSQIVNEIEWIRLLLVADAIEADNRQSA